MSDPPADGVAQHWKLPVRKVDATLSGVEDFPLFWERYALNRDINVSNGYWTTDAGQAQQFARLLTGDAFKHYASLPTTTKEV